VRNDIAGEGSAEIGTVGAQRGGERIVDQHGVAVVCAEVGEVAVLHFRKRHAVLRAVLAILRIAIEAQHVKELVATVKELRNEDGSIGLEAIVVLNEIGPCHTRAIVGKGVGVQTVIVATIEDGAVEFIGAGLGGAADDAAAGAAILRVVDAQIRAQES
jgi:hypothetical protein